MRDIKHLSPQARSNRKLRAFRVASGLCQSCGVKSKTYRCAACNATRLPGLLAGIKRRIEAARALLTSPASSRKKRTPSPASSVKKMAAPSPLRVLKNSGHTKTRKAKNG
jgi:hypothetical protein